MTYTATPEDIQKVRYELNDNAGPGLYILDDTIISYYLEKNQGSLARTSIDCCRAILLRLSMDSKDQVIDILAVKSHKTAEQYRLALELYLKNPSLNPLINAANCYAGGISNQDIADNLADLDQNTVSPPISTFSRVSKSESTYSYDNPFMI